MDLGISGRRAIVCASSRGLGRACAQALAREGVHVTLNGRDDEALKESVALCEAHGVEVNSVLGDMNLESTRDALLDEAIIPSATYTSTSRSSDTSLGGLG